MYCLFCGSKLEKNNTVCGKCGKCNTKKPKSSQNLKTVKNTNNTFSSNHNSKSINLEKTTTSAKEELIKFLNICNSIESTIDLTDYIINNAKSNDDAKDSKIMNILAVIVVGIPAIVLYNTESLLKTLLVALLVFVICFFVLAFASGKEEQKVREGMHTKAERINRLREESVYEKIMPQIKKQSTIHLGKIIKNDSVYSVAKKYASELSNGNVDELYNNLHYEFDKMAHQAYIDIASQNPEFTISDVLKKYYIEEKSKMINNCINAIRQRVQVIQEKFQKYPRDKYAQLFITEYNEFENKIETMMEINAKEYRYSFDTFRYQIEFAIKQIESQIDMRCAEAENIIKQEIDTENSRRYNLSVLKDIGMDNEFDDDNTKLYIHKYALAKKYMDHIYAEETEYELL